MKLFTLLLSGLTCSWACAAYADGQPRGSLLELHSCELYAGGCIVSSESTLGGRYMLRMWNFAGGNFSGVDLAGLQLAVLQSSSENLAAPDSETGSAVIYLPIAASSAQRTALMDWLKASQPDFKPSVVQTRTVSMQFESTEKGCIFSAGEYVSVKTAARESCETGACGEALWYTPRASSSVFTVAVDHSSNVAEPLLKLNWSDAGKRSVFLAKFGQETTGRSRFVSLAELCGPNPKVL
jgi:hypothetical protein